MQYCIWRTLAMGAKTPFHFVLFLAHLSAGVCQTSKEEPALFSFGMLRAWTEGHLGQVSWMSPDLHKTLWTTSRTTWRLNDPVVPRWQVVNQSKIGHVALLVYSRLIVLGLTRPWERKNETQNLPAQELISLCRLPTAVHAEDHTWSEKAKSTAEDFREVIKSSPTLTGVDWNWHPWHLPAPFMVVLDVSTLDNMLAMVPVALSSIWDNLYSGE